MPNSKREDKTRIKIFLDTSVIIAAILSPTGGSFRLIRESILKDYILLISDYVLDECIRTLKIKFPTKLNTLTSFLTNYNFQILKDPTEKEVEKLIKIINFRDAPVLGGALKHKAEYLITLDKKDFLNPKVLEFVKKKNLLVLTPKEFLERIERKN
jgi:hypothetical protein